jgi:predicted small secreted protein
MKSLATLLALCIAFAGTFTLTGCNTVQGAGQDIQKAGSAVEGAASKKKDY